LDRAHHRTASFLLWGNRGQRAPCVSGRVAALERKQSGKPKEEIDIRVETLASQGSADSEPEKRDPQVRKRVAKRVEARGTDETKADRNRAKEIDPIFK